MISKIFILLVKLYQNTLSFALPCSCRFHPTCSHYMIDALKKRGLFWGFVLGFKRIMRCNPFSKHSGYDPI